MDFTVFTLEMSSRARSEGSHVLSKPLRCEIPRSALGMTQREMCREGKYHIVIHLKKMCPHDSRWRRWPSRRSECGGGLAGGGHTADNAFLQRCATVYHQTTARSW